MIRIFKVLFGAICILFGLYVAKFTASSINDLHFTHVIVSFIFGLFSIIFGLFIFAEGIRPNKINSSD